MLFFMKRCLDLYSNYYLFCVQLWLGLAALCVLDQDHSERLSSGEWVASQDGQHGHPRVSILIIEI